MNRNELFRFVRAAALGTLVLHAVPSRADIAWCSTRVSEVSVSSTGTLIVQTGLGVFYMCNLGTSSWGVSTQACQAWLAQFTTARVSNQLIAMDFDFGSSAAPSCSYGFAGTWVVPNPFPYYIGFQ